MITLTTHRLQLRPWRLEDVEFIYDMYARWAVQQFIGNVPRVMTDRAEAAERLASWQHLDDPISGIWAAERRDDGQLLGTILLKSIPATGPEPCGLSGDTEIGWHFHPDYWGNGYAVEGAAAAKAHGFDNGLERIVAVTNPQNFPSQRVCTRLGMTPHGLTRKYYNSVCSLFVAVPSKDELHTQQRSVDRNIYSPHQR